MHAIGRVVSLGQAPEKRCVLGVVPGVEEGGGWVGWRALYLGSRWVVGGLGGGGGGVAGDAITVVGLMARMVMVIAGERSDDGDGRWLRPAVIIRS